MKHGMKIIHEVKNRPLLYDQFRTMKSSENKNEQWKEVAKSVYRREDNAAVNKVKLQWKSIRDAFVKQQRKRQSSGTTVRPYIYEHDLQFLLPHILLKDRDDYSSPDVLTSEIDIKEESSSSGESHQDLEHDEILICDKDIRTNDSRSDKGEDPVDAFFHGVAQTVKKLNPLTVARLKKTVANLVIDAEIEELERKDFVAA